MRSSSLSLSIFSFASAILTSIERFLGMSVSLVFTHGIQPPVFTWIPWLLIKPNHTKTPFFYLPSGNSKTGTVSLIVKVVLCNNKASLDSKIFCGPGIKAAIETTVFKVSRVSTSLFKLRTISRSLRLGVGSGVSDGRLPQTHF